MIFDVYSKKFVSVGNIRICYFDEGGGKDVILLVHGLGGYKENWTLTIKGLCGEYRCVAIDLPGFGDSDKPKLEYTMEFFADFLLDFLRKLGIDEINIVGNSMGGTISFLFAERHRNIVNTLTLVDSAGLRLKEEKLIFNPKLFLDKGIPFRPPPQMIEYMIKDLLFENPPPLADEMVRRAINLWWGSEKEFEERSYAYLKSALYLFERDFSDIIKRIDVPTLVVWGDRDKMLPVKFADEFSRMIKNSHKIIIQNCGHSPQIEKPDEFNRALHNFLSSPR